jgi:very-short-patch-repair endonuclease
MLLDAHAVWKSTNVAFTTTAEGKQRKELRNSLTAAEAVLWKNLQDCRLVGKKFRRQESIGPYIADFYCPESRLIVELDGAGHNSVSGAEHDAKRTEYLRQRGLRVIRFENKAVFDDLKWVLEVIRKNLLD